VPPKSQNPYRKPCVCIGSGYGCGLGEKKGMLTSCRGENKTHLGRKRLEGKRGGPQGTQKQRGRGGGMIRGRGQEKKEKGDGGQ